MSSSSSAQDAEVNALVLKRMLQLENAQQYRDVDEETLQQMLSMCDGDILQSFIMVHGQDPSSRVKLDEIMEQVRTEKKTSSSLVGSSNDTPSNLLIITEDDNPQSSEQTVVPPPPTTTTMAANVTSADHVEIEMDESSGSDSGSGSSDDASDKSVELSLDMELKIRALRIKIKDRAPKYTNTDDGFLASLLTANDHDVEHTMQYLESLSNDSRDTLSPPKYVPPYEQPMTWDKNPSIPIPKEELEKMEQEGRIFYKPDALPVDCLEHVSVKLFI